MDRLACMKVFGEVARLQSFSLAAAQLNMSRATVSKHVAWLERALGTQLLLRTTKHVSLTDAGLRVLENGLLLLERYAEIEADVKDSMSIPRGVLRISAPVWFGSHHLTPLVSRFTQMYPDIQVALSVDDGRTSPLTGGLDVTVRFTTALEDASFVAMPLVRIPQVLVAAPDYLAKAGTPGSVAELLKHNCLVHTIKSPTADWRFTGPSGVLSVKAKGTLCASFGDALRLAALAGDGLSVHPLYMVHDDIKTGHLVSVLADTPPLALEMVAIYSSRRNVPSRVRVFLEFMREWARNPPDWALPHRRS